MAWDFSTDPDFQAHSLERMHVEAERMARMVAQLLILARSDVAVAAAHEPILLGDIVVEACRQRQDLKTRTFYVTTGAGAEGSGSGPGRQLGV